MGKSKPRPVYFSLFPRKTKAKTMEMTKEQRDGRHRRPLDELIAEASVDSFGQKTGHWAGAHIVGSRFLRSSC